MSEFEIDFNKCKDTGFPNKDMDEQDKDDVVLFIHTTRKNFEGFMRQKVKKASRQERHKQCLVPQMRQPTEEYGSK